MASLTKITKRRRQLKAQKLGRKARKARTKASTPKFEIHQTAAK